MANPVVNLRPVRRGGYVTSYVVWCSTDACEFVHVDQLKTGAQTEQRTHARKHRQQGMRDRARAGVGG